MCVSVRIKLIAKGNTKSIENIRQKFQIILKEILWEKPATFIRKSRDYPVTFLVIMSSWNYGCSVTTNKSPKYGLPARINFNAAGNPKKYETTKKFRQSRQWHTILWTREPPCTLLVHPALVLLLHPPVEADSLHGQLHLEGALRFWQSAGVGWSRCRCRCRVFR